MRLRETIDAKVDDLQLKPKKPLHLCILGSVKQFANNIFNNKNFCLPKIAYETI